MTDEDNRMQSSGTGFGPEIEMHSNNSSTASTPSGVRETDGMLSVGGDIPSKLLGGSEIGSSSSRLRNGIEVSLSPSDGDLDGSCSTPPPWEPSGSWFRDLLFFCGPGE